MYFYSAYLAYLMILGTYVHCDDALKNHRAEKRQDNDFLFFGGWRPVGSRSSYYQASASNRYHDLISALPNNFDPASRYYTHAMPSTYHKDIYSYYPRPAIKSVPKKNTPVYMERLRPQMQQQKYVGRGAENFKPQIIDFPQIDLKQIQNLQELIHRAKEIPFPPINLPFGGGKPVDIVEVSLHSLQQGGQSYGGKSSSGYNRNRSSPRNQKSGYARVTQSRIPFQSPAQYEYIAVPKNNPVISQILPKEIAVTPVKLPHAIPSVEELLRAKNVQIVEVPVPSGLYDIQGGKTSHSSQYEIANVPNTLQYTVPHQKSQTRYPEASHYNRQSEQSNKHYRTPKQQSSVAQKEPTIEAELVKLNEEDLKGILSNLQVLDKAPHDLLKYLSLGDLQKVKEEIQLVLPVSEGGYGHGGGSQSYQSQPQNDRYASEDQYSGNSYSSKEPSSYGLNSGLYHIVEQGGNQVELSSSGYQVSHVSKTSERHYGGSSGYQQPSEYEGGHHGDQGNDYESADQGYSKSTDDSDRDQQGVYTQRQHSYIQVIAPPDKNGYRREPVLAVEIQHGQTVEEAIKSLDHETLKKLGAHGKDGLEIEVVEVPIDEYASESKKVETVVSSKNSTLTFKKKIDTKKS